MARIFITGSADGLGQLAATALITDGHNVVLHARNNKRGQEALAKVPGAESVLTADLGEPRGCQMSDVRCNHRSRRYPRAEDVFFA